MSAAWLRLRKPARDSTDPQSIAARLVSRPFSRSLPAGKATAAWKKTQTLSTQKVSVCVQWCAAERVVSAAPKAYSNMLIPSIATQGSSTMVHRGWPSNCRSVSPMR